MPSTQDITAYTVTGGAEGNTPGGTGYFANINMTITPGTDFADADAFAIFNAMLAAFPAGWNVTAPESMNIQKGDTELTSYTTNYTSNPPSFT